MSPKTVFLAVSLWMIAALYAPGAFADALSNAPMIFDVRRSLPLEPTEPVYHDFYINAGAEAGFRKGLYVNVVRLVPVHNPIMNKQQAELPVQIGKLQVLQVASGMTVARLITEISDEERPTLEYESVMIGDHIDTASFSTEGPKKRLKTAHDRSAFDETVVAAKAEREARDRAEARFEAKVERAEASAPAPAPARNVSAAPVAEIKAEAPASAKVAGLAPAPAAEAKTTSPAAPATAMVPVPAPATATH